MTGEIPASELARLNLANPENRVITLEIDFYENSPITDLSGRIFKPTSGGEMTVELSLPRIPEEATALYIERGQPGGTWVRVSHAEGENFISKLSLRAPRHYLAFRLPLEYGVTRLRVVVEGSGLAGVSNVILLSPPNAITLPPDGGDDDWDDGSDDGNRGGGGQGESDREKPSAPKATAEPSPLPAPTPQPMPNMEAAVAPAELDTGLLSGTDASGGSGGSSSGLYRPARVPAPSPEPSATDADSDEEAPPTPQEEAVGSASPEPTDSAAQAEQPPAVVETEEEPPPPVSRGAVTVAAASSLAVGGLGAATYIIRKRKP